MGPLLVEAAGLMWGRAAVAGPGPGGGPGASRLPPWGLWGRLGLSAQFAVLCCGVLKGAAGGHDDVCFAFGRNLACR